LTASFALIASQPASAQTAPAPRQADAADPQTVEQIVVQGSFLGAGSQSAMKLDVPVRDTPFSVSAYTDSFMKAIETSNVADMYNYMTGVKRAGNTGYDLTIRGFKTSANDRNAILVDGLPGLSGRIGSPPTIGIERLELVKGPMSVLYGQAQPGGFVNLIAKKPRAKQALEVDLKGTTYASGISVRSTPSAVSSTASSRRPPTRTASAPPRTRNRSSSRRASPGTSPTIPSRP
jgi:iron complex outermembrane receptor protein